MTKKQQENLIKRIAKEITNEFSGLKTKYEYDDIYNEWVIYSNKEIKDEYVDFLNEKRDEIENEGILVSIVYDLSEFRKELVEA